MTVLRGFAFPLRFGPLGHLERAEGVEKIECNLRVIVKTLLGERIMVPGFGTVGLAAVLRNMDASTSALIREVFTKAIARHEPRVRVRNVRTTPDRTEGLLHVNIDYTVLASGENGSVPVVVR